MREFLAMSGYGVFVWSCYAITFIVLIFNVVANRRRLKSALEAARQSEATAKPSAQARIKELT
jgi:heme exporter protein CcmD